MSSLRREVLDGVQAQESTHAGLWMDRYLCDPEAPKQGHLETLETLRVPAGYREFFERWKASLEKLPDTLLTKATVRGRMAVGLGAESVLETSVSLHRTYGVPFIPGSGLKGLAAAAAHRHLEHPDWRKAAGGQPVGPSHRLLFGELEQGGAVVFHDALWIPDEKLLPLNLDVMTVHHTHYYQGEPLPPADWDNPVPVAFASARGSYLIALTGPADWAEAALAILRKALEEDGIGAKTAAGYGRMEFPPAPPAVDWESRVRNIAMNNVGYEAPRLLAELQGEARRLAAKAILLKLGRLGPNHKDKAWAQELLKAAE
jgi:CRISPR-associated protein Cmr6